MYSRDLFTFDSFSGVLSASMSDLGLKPGEIPTSFVVPSHEGDEITFNYYGTIRQDGEILYHAYLSEHLFNNGLTKAKLYND